jgi:hypothetical protein
MDRNVIQQIYELRADLRFLRKCEVKPEFVEMRNHLIRSLENECVVLLQSETVRRLAMWHERRRAEKRKAA